MSRRNVDLVISAKDEAAKVLDQITAALEQFTTASRGVDGSAEKTESSLGQLGAAISKLQKNLGDLNVADKLGSELSKAEKEIVRLETAFDGTKAEAEAFEKSLADTGARVDRFSRQLDGAKAALSRQKTAIKTAKTNQRELAASYTQAEKAQEKLTARQAKLPALIDKQTVALDKAKSRYSELADQISRVDEPSKSLQKTFDASARNVERNTQSLQKLTTEYGEIGGKVRAAQSAMTIFGEQAKRATATVSSQQGVLAKIEKDLTGIGARYKAAGAAQSDLTKKLDSTNNALARQGAQIARAEGHYVELAQSAGKADVALESLSKQSLGKLDSQLKDQRRSTLEAKRGYIELTKEATRLATQIANTAKPSAALILSFDKAKNSAKEAKAAYQTQLVTLEKLGRVYRETGADMDSINAAQARFQAILRQSNTALEANAAAAARAEKELIGLSAASTKAASSSSRIAQNSRALASANQRAAGSTSQLAAAYRQFYGDSRQSLSLLQRIRGEVLSLVAAYGGLYGAIEVLRGTVTAYEQLEAAQSRLNVATGGDQEKTAKELDYLRRTADRLGISFGTLATEYSKFSIATKDTNLEGANTRKIFTAVAEAARVNRSSTQEMAGVFTALTQIVSKGAVQMEELRQQLGDRLPGAIKLMADGLNVGTDELIKMMEQGEVTAEALVPFAEELQEKFGSGLPDALESVSAAIGRLANEAFEALIRFGEAGFLESFQNFADTLVATLKSAEFQDFAARASKAIGTLVDLLGFAAENFRVFLAVGAGFLGLKLTPIFIALGSALNVTTFAATKTGASFSVLQARAAAMGVTVTRTGYAVRTLRAALVGLMSTTGIGLLVAAIGTGIALWATHATDATEAMTEHEKIVDDVKNAYDAVGGSVEEWKKKLDTITASEAEANLRRIKEALRGVQDEFDLLARGNDSFLTNFFGYNLSAGQEIFNVSDEYKKAVQSIVKSYRDTSLPADQLISSLEEVNAEYRDGSEEASQFAEALVKMARKELELSAATEEAADVYTARAGAVDESEEAFKRLSNTIDEVKTPTGKFADAMERLKAASENIAGDLPKAATEAEEAAKKGQELADAYEQALAAARALPEAIQRAGAEQKALKEYTEGMNAALRSSEMKMGSQYDQYTTGASAAAAFIRKKEGYEPKAYWDVNAWRNGFGSDTMTDAQGNKSAVTQNSVTTIEGAMRDLTRRLTEEFIPAVKAAIGGERFDGMTPQQQAALTSLAYNYGAGAFDKGALRGIRDAIKSGASDETVAGLIQARGEDNGGVNRVRRNDEAGLYLTQAGVVKVVEEQEKLNEKRAEFREGLTQEVETMQQEAALQSESLIKQEQGKAIREAELEAKKLGLTLTDQERASINEAVAAKFASKQQENEIADAKERAAAATERVNALLAQRRALDDQLALAKAEGDAEKTDEFEQKLVAVNEQLTQAIENAKQMWAAIGGDAADNAIIKLETAALKADTLDKQAEKNYLDWSRVGDLFVNGLSNAFDSFSQAVAEGQSIGEAARNSFLQFAADFLRQIAQMIIQQAIFNALKSSFGGTSFGSLIGIGHTGGLIGSSRVGSGNGTRRVSPAMFAGAARYHSGGIIGLKPGEVPIIAEQGEEMLTRDDPRHMLNGGGGGNGGGQATPQSVKVVNAIDSGSFIDAGLNSKTGEKAILNFMRANAGTVKSIIG
jgi:tape measure domain-containing protein